MRGEAIAGGLGRGEKPSCAWERAQRGGGRERRSRTARRAGAELGWKRENEVREE